LHFLLLALHVESVCLSFVLLPLSHVLHSLLLQVDPSTKEVTAVVLESGETCPTENVVITTGTFLRAFLHFGPTHKEVGGRIGDDASFGLSDTFESLGFELGRLTTATPPRLDGRTVDWDETQPQGGDDPPEPFSYTNERISEELCSKQLNSFITHTTEETHDIIRQNLHLLPTFIGNDGTAQKNNPHRSQEKT
jgi:tRNA uridine 5-carboxymethylaminomethyl modification enzyme